MSHAPPIHSSRGAAAAALAATLGVLSATAVLAPEQENVRPVRADLPQPGALGLHVVFQLEDCASTLAFLEILDHPSLAGRVGLSSLLLVGEAEDVPGAARALRGIARDRRIRVASGATRRALRRMGFRRTPFFLVEDAGGVVRFAAPVPGGPRELRSLHASLRALADLEERRAGVAA